jgi:polyribonucleotide nucleotidyltransferase
VPRIEQLIIPNEFIGAVIGTGGKVIQEIQKVTGTTITITEEGKVGIVEIFGESKESIEAALNWVKGITTVPEVGALYTGKITSILEFGAFVEILPGKEGLLHISEMAWGKTNKVEDVVQIGDEVTVKLLEVDERSGKLRLSIRALQEKPEGYFEPERRPHPSRGGDRRDGRRGGDRDRDRKPRR